MVNENENNDSNDDTDKKNVSNNKKEKEPWNKHHSDFKVCLFFETTIKDDSLY